MNVIFYNLIHVSSNEMVNMHSKWVNFHIGQSKYRHPEVGVDKAIKFLMLV